MFWFGDVQTDFGSCKCSTNKLYTFIPMTTLRLNNLTLFGDGVTLTIDPLKNQNRYITFIIGLLHNINHLSGYFFYNKQKRNRNKVPVSPYAHHYGHIGQNCEDL